MQKNYATKKADRFIHDNGKIEYIYYLAICSYDNNQYYLFHCNNKFEVIADYLFDSIEECKSIASKSIKDKVFSQ